MKIMFYPVFLNLQNKRCLVVGAGNVACRKIGKLLKAKADITVVAPDAIKSVEKLFSENLIKWEKKVYESPEAANYELVVSAVDDWEVSRIVAEDCRKAKIPVNVVDKPDLCSFIVPATINKGDITIAISSSGNAPFLTKQIRMELEKIIPDYWEQLSEIASKFRAVVMERYKDNKEAKQNCFKRFFDLDWEVLLSSDNMDAIDRNLKFILSESAPHE
ncbi:MAG: bifunctional precorrin-2 dehydrogenase/sirohydrochlorin ferrochelatase [candidate division Zixibacteria bacterium]|nr:bifunctional precorrin-2 dehydrogenase/sirohydrochlorin ferrochelatase [candidate division Zixibacteria bacterium]